MKVIDLEDTKHEEEVRPSSRGSWMEGKDEKKGDETQTAKFVMSMLALKFTDSVTMHGLRYVFMREAHYLRRIVWLLLITAGFAYCSYIVYQSWTSFLSYPTTIRVTRRFEAKSEFPAVTICPYNMFRRSGITEEQAKALEGVFSVDFLPNTFEEANLTDYDGLDILGFFKNGSYKFGSQFCLYKGKVCDSRLKSFVLTDFGYCLLFDPSFNESYKHQDSAGQPGGFDWSEIINEADWTYGPYMTYDGFRVTVHPPGSKVYYLKDKGFSLLPGYATDVSIQRKETKLLPPPHGQCGHSKLTYYDEYSREMCVLECRTNHTVDVCGCRFVYMPGESKLCTMAQIRSCNTILSDGVVGQANNSKLFDQTKCNCPQDCFSVDYQVHASLTAPTTGIKKLFTEAYNSDISNGMEIRVFYAELETLELTEQAIYSFEKLLCDVGGAGGLFLGCSFATVFEFVDFGMGMAWMWMLKEYTGKKVTRDQIKVIK